MKFYQNKKITNKINILWFLLKSLIKDRLLPTNSKIETSNTKILYIGHKSHKEKQRSRKKFEKKSLV